MVHVFSESTTLGSRHALLAGVLATIFVFGYMWRISSFGTAFSSGVLFSFYVALSYGVAEQIFGIAAPNNFLFQTGRPLESFGLASSFGNPNNYALYLFITTTVLLALVSRMKSRTGELALAIALITAPGIMFLTESRTGLILLGFAYLARIVLSRIPTKRPGSSEPRGAGLVLLAISALALALLIAPSLMGMVSSDASGVARVTLVKAGVALFGQSPVVGSGAGSFEEFMVGHGYSYGTSLVNSHNGMIEVLAEYGLLVFAACGVLVLRLLRLGLGSLHSSHSEVQRGCAIVLVTLLGGLPLAVTMHSSFLYNYMSWFYVSAVLVAAAGCASFGPDKSARSMATISGVAASSVTGHWVGHE